MSMVSNIFYNVIIHVGNLKVKENRMAKVKTKAFLKLLDEKMLVQRKVA